MLAELGGLALRRAPKGARAKQDPQYLYGERPNLEWGTLEMTKVFFDSLLRLRKDEAGQGLVEYLLILALIAFAATAGMGSLASGLNSAFSAVGSILGAYIT